MTSSLQVGARHAVAAAIVFAFAFVGLAEDVVFPYSEAVGDLSSAADWGKDQIPSADSRIQIGTGSKSQTVTALTDIDFAGIYRVGASSTVIFDMRDAVTGASPRKINMTAGVSGSKSAGRTTWFKGGEWNWNGKSLSLFTADYETYNNNSYKITDGAVMYNVSSLQGAYGSTYGSFLVAGEGTLVTTKVLAVAFYQGSRQTFTVADGARVVINGTGSPKDYSNDNEGSYNRTIVTNGASLVKVTGSANHIGIKGLGNEVHVVDHSTMSLSGYTYVGHSDGDGANAANNTRVLVDDNSTFIPGGVYLGNGNGRTTGNSGCTIESRNGSTVTISSLFLHGRDNGLIASNGTFVLQTAGILTHYTNVGQNFSSSNAYVRVQGETPRVRIATGTDANQFCCKDGFRLIYDLPVDGYADGYVPVTFEKYGQFDDTFEVEINGLEAMQAKMQAERIRKRTIRLFKANNGLVGVSSATVDRWRSRLPEGVTLNTAGEVSLTVKADLGFMLIFR